jgi:hypothetical protein
MPVPAVLPARPETPASVNGPGPTIITKNTAIFRVSIGAYREKMRAINFQPAMRSMASQTFTAHFFSECVYTCQNGGRSDRKARAQSRWFRVCESMRVVTRSMTHHDSGADALQMAKQLY